MIKTGDPRITKPDGSKPGIWVAASSDPDSADCHPTNFNRWAGILRDHGQPAPDPVPEHSRRLDHRWPLLSPERGRGPLQRGVRGSDTAAGELP